VGFCFAGREFRHGVIVEGERLEEVLDSGAEEGDLLGGEEVWQDEVAVSVEFGEVEAGWGGGGEGGGRVEGGGRHCCGGVVGGDKDTE